MKRFFFLVLCCWTALASVSPIRASSEHIWYVTSPDHGQTYAYGSEQSRVWKMLGSHDHLAVYMTFNNNPFAEGSNQRFDTFTFNFPQVRLGPGGHTFFYSAANGLDLPVAARDRGFFGIVEIKLLPTAFLQVKKQHGFLTLTLIIGDAPLETNPGIEIGIEH
jgi:hypothetical protein